MKSTRRLIGVRLVALLSVLCFSGERFEGKARLLIILMIIKVEFLTGVASNKTCDACSVF